MNQRVRRVLEIGYGGLFLGADRMREFRKILPSDIHYHGIDLANKKTETIALLRRTGSHVEAGAAEIFNEHMVEAEREFRDLNPTSIHLFRMNGQQLAFRDASFDEVYMVRLASDPRLHEVIIKYLIREMARVLMPGGKAVIVGDKWGKRVRSETPRMDIATAALREAGLILDERPDAVQQAILFHSAIKTLVKGPEYFTIVAQKT